MTFSNTPAPQDSPIRQPQSAVRQPGLRQPALHQPGLRQTGLSQPGLRRSALVLGFLATLGGCGAPGAVTTGVSSMTTGIKDRFRGDTERRTTAYVDYNDVAMTHEEAQAMARGNCGEAEVLSVSPPVLQPNGLFRVTASCLATYDGRGRLVPNAH